MMTPMGLIGFRFSRFFEALTECEEASDLFGDDAQAGAQEERSRGAVARFLGILRSHMKCV